MSASAASISARSISRSSAVGLGEHLAGGGEVVVGLRAAARPQLDERSSSL